MTTGELQMSIPNTGLYETAFRFSFLLCLEKSFVETVKRKMMDLFHIFIAGAGRFTLCLSLKV